MESERIARVLDEMGTLMEIGGEDAFRCRAYHNAALAVRALPANLAELIVRNELKEVPGLGKAMVAKVVELATTGRLEAYDALRRDTPPGLVALMRVPGLGPKKVKALRDELKITGLTDLRAAAEAGKVAGLKGFGAKTQAKILEGIRFVETAAERILISQAGRLVAPLLASIRAEPGVIRAEACGSYRRRRETIGDLDLLFSSDDPAPILDAFAKRPEVVEVLGHGPTKVSVRLVDGVQCDLRGVTDPQFPFALHYFTGSKAHNIAMRKRAIARGLKLNEYGLEDAEGRSPAIGSEEELFRALGLAYIPPELREDQGEFEAAERGTLPRLIERSDLLGTFHCHSDWSDGGATLEEMAEASIAAGLTYLGIADHSRAAAYANGLSIDRVRRQWEEIDALNRKYGKTFRIFKGTECDILADGSLDFPDEVLASFDYVVASVHSSFGLPRDEMTARLVRAAQHPLVTMLGHPSGRLLLTRDSYAVDLDAVVDAAAGAGTMIEINANPHRLDLDAMQARRARDRGVLLAINPDAHSTGGLDDLDYGIGEARRAWLEPADVLNTRPAAEVESRFEASRNRAGR